MGAMHDVASVYRWIVEDVISKAKPEFNHDEVDESTLQELRELWEKKLLETGCLNPPEEPASLTKPAAASAAGQSREVKQDTQDPGNRQPTADAQASGIKRKAEEIPQLDGTDDSEPVESEAIKCGLDLSDLAAEIAKRNLTIPQQDGEEDDEDEDALDDDDDVSLGDTSDDEEFENNPDNLVLAQFEKVSRTKTRWKCQLKAGIMHINGRDYIFNKAIGEFQF